MEAGAEDGEDQGGEGEEEKAADLAAAFGVLDRCLLRWMRWRGHGSLERFSLGCRRALLCRAFSALLFCAASP